MGGGRGLAGWMCGWMGVWVSGGSGIGMVVVGDVDLGKDWVRRVEGESG